MKKANKFINKSIRLKGYDYNLPGAYFITICVKDRKCLFGDIKKEVMILNDFGRIANDCWLNIPEHFENVEPVTFVIMPNHMHGIIFILEDDNYLKNIVGQTHAFDSSRHALNLQTKVSQNDLMHNKLSTVMGSYKSAVTKKINSYVKQSGFTWQTSFHDHIIRSEKEMQNIANYIELNPSNWNEDFENEKYCATLTDKERKNLLKEVYKNFM